MTSSTDITRPNQVLEVLQLMSSEGISQQEACSRAGINPRTFRWWLTREREAIDGLRSLITDLEREQMLKIIEARRALIDNMVEQATSGSLGLGATLDLESRLHSLQDQLGNELGIKANTSTDAGNFVLPLRPAQSRFTITVTETPPAIIDAQAREIEPE